MKNPAPHNPFGDHNYRDTVYWLSPRDESLEQRHLAMMNEAQRLQNLSNLLITVTTAPPSKEKPPA